MEDINYTYLFAGLAVLITVLALWANLWVSFARSDAQDSNIEKRHKKTSATLGIFWIYTATLIALVSVAFVLMGKYWVDLPSGQQNWCSQLGFGFLMTAVIMALLNIFESALSVLFKGLRGKTAFDSLSGVESEKLWIYFTIEIVIILMLLAFSTMGVLECHRWWWFYILPVIIGACVFIGASKTKRNGEEKTKEAVDEHTLDAQA